MCFVLFSFYDCKDYYVIDCDIPSGNPVPCPNCLELNRKTFSHTNDLYIGENLNPNKYKIEISFHVALQISIIGLGVLLLLWLSLLYLCT